MGPRPDRTGTASDHQPQRLNITLEYPSPWLEFPLGPDADVERWAKAEADRIVGSASGEGVPDITRLLRPSAADLTEELLLRARGYRERRLVFALGCYPPGIDTSDVGLEVGSLCPGAAGPAAPAAPVRAASGDAPPALQWFAGRSIVRGLGEPDVRYGELASGRTVRLRQNHPGSRRSWFGGRPVHRSLVYGIVPHDQHTVITVTARWTDPSIDEYIEEWTDEIAGSVQADPAD